MTRRQQFRPYTTRWLFVVFTVLCFLASLRAIPASATDVTWTPNHADEEGSGPLPLSSKQRQQLLQLEEVIRTSPNPEATLKEAAEANGMQPQELMSMLQRNRSDLEQGAGGAGNGNSMSSTIGGALGRLLTAVFAFIAKSATQNPKAFALITTSILLVLMLAATAPRTGLVLSNHRGFLSKGPTTVFQPPTRFLEKRLALPQWQQHEAKSAQLSPAAWKELTTQQDGETWRKKMPKDSEVAQAASFQITIPIHDFLEEGLEDDDEEIDFCHDTCYNNAVDVINLQQLTEFAPANSLRLFTLQKGDSGRKRFSVLVVKKLGDFGRFGLVPLQVTQKQENDKATSITYSALKGAHFAGQIRVSAEKRKGKKGSNPSVVLLVHLAFPKKAHRLSSKTALKIASLLSESIAASVKTRTRQSLARRSQSSNFKGKVRARAEERRHTRFQKEKELEEMAEDRRRKWQRNNPNAGRYRPSGDRQRSPNNC